MENSDHTLVPILTASLIHEVHIAKTLLASQGIESFIFDKNIENVIGTAYVQGYKLEVDSRNVERALKILDEVKEDND